MSASFTLPTVCNKRGEIVGSRTQKLLEASLFIDKLDPGCPWEIIVRRWKKSRTNAQNAALFGLAYKLICEDTGHDKDELHEAFCCKFFGTREVEIGGITIKKPVRTTTRNEHGKRDVIPWDMFSDFYTLVEDTAASIGILVPPPDPNWRSEKVLTESINK